MVTMTRELERGLIEAGVPEERAREIVDGLEARLAELATKEDLQHEIAALHREMDLRFDAIDARFDGMEKRFDDLKQTMWRIFAWLAALLTAMVATLLGALMYAVFG